LMAPPPPAAARAAAASAGGVSPAQLAAALGNVASAAAATTTTAGSTPAATPGHGAASRPLSAQPGGSAGGGGLAGLITPGFMSPSGLLSPGAGRDTAGAGMGLGSGMQTNDCLEALLADPNLLGLLSPGEAGWAEVTPWWCMRSYVWTGAECGLDACDGPAAGKR
jgi:hypothetical protein